MREKWMKKAFIFHHIYSYILCRRLQINQKTTQSSAKTSMHLFAVALQQPQKENSQQEEMRYTPFQRQFIFPFIHQMFVGGIFYAKRKMIRQTNMKHHSLIVATNRKKWSEEVQTNKQTNEQEREKKRRNKPNE